MDDPNLMLPEEGADAVTATQSPPKKNGKGTKTKDKPAAEPKSEVNSKVVEKEDILGDLAAAQRAVRDQTSVATGYTYQVALGCITGNLNYRAEPSTLASLGYKLVDSEDPEHSLLHMCLSKDMDIVRAVVGLFDAHEGNPSGEDEDAKVADKSTSIVSLATKFEQVGQLQPVVVRSVGGKNSVSVHLVFGQRRVAAAAYRHARSRVQVEDGVEGVKVVPAVVRATFAKVAADEALMMAVSENSDRKPDDPVQEGSAYALFLGMIDPATGKKYTLDGVGALLNVDKGRVRSYAALTKPKEKKKDGRVVGLTDDERELVRTGKRTRTWGIRKALGEKHYSDGHRQTNRSKPIPMKAMQELFDNTAETNIERRTAIAECMGFPPDGLAEAVKQSEDRIAESEGKKPRGKRHDASEETDPEKEGDAEE